MPSPPTDTNSAELLLEKASLKEVYPLATDAELAAQEARYTQFATTFKSLYNGKTPDIAVRGPGRVNLIGEHIDYSDFSVLPMAVDRDMLMGVSFLDETVDPSVAKDDTVRVRLTNLNQEEFPARVIWLPKDPTKFVDIDPKISDWGNYFKCGVVVAQEFLINHMKSSSSSSEQEQNKNALVENIKSMRPMDVLVTGNVPTGSGLSSSAAFVVCATLSILLGYGFKPTRKLLTQLSIKCEQHVGVNSGGMDQSASIYGLVDHALFVTFKPTLTATPFSFSKDQSSGSDNADSEPFSFVIANSLIVSNKHETAPFNYNLRVVEVTLAALVLAKHLNPSATGPLLPADGNLQAGTLRNVLELVFPDPNNTFGTDSNENFKTTIAQLNALESLANKVLGASEDNPDTEVGGHSTKKVAELLGVSEEDLVKRYMTTYPVKYNYLSLKKRAIHVYSEAARVFKFISALNSASSSSPSSTSASLIDTLGQLINESHESAIHYFQNSHPTVDRLCEIARSNGTAGSRITGAGWGGATVHLVPTSKADGLVKALTSEYYLKEFPTLTQADIDDAIILSKPGNGTTILVDDFFSKF